MKVTKLFSLLEELSKKLIVLVDLGIESATRSVEKDRQKAETEGLDDDPRFEDFKYSRVSDVVGDLERAQNKLAEMKSGKDKYDNDVEVDKEVLDKFEKYTESLKQRTMAYVESKTLEV